MSVSFWIGVWRMVLYCILLLYIIIYYILYYYTYTIISYIIIHILLYLILYSSPLLIYLLLYLPPPIPLIHSIRVGTYIRLFILYYSIPIFFSAILPILLIFLPIPSILSFLYLSPIHSIRVGTYITLFIFRGDSWDDILTPHVLSEWMVEVCRFYLCGELCSLLSVSIWRFELMFERLSDDWCWVAILSLQQFWPRMFYRSGWLRCVGLMSVGSCLIFMFDAGVYVG